MTIQSVNAVARPGAILVALLSIVVGCGQVDEALDQAPPAPAPSVVQLLERIAVEADHRANPYLNPRRVEWLRQEVEQADDEVKKFEMQIQLSYELLLAGETSRAIHRLEQLDRIYRDSGADPTNKIRKQVREWLGVAYLRLGEQRNCIANHGVDSCLMPIEGSGVHTDKRGSRQAIEHYRLLLADFPDDPAYRWLLNLAYMTVGEHPGGVPAEWLIPRSLFDSAAELPRFYDRATDSGLDVTGLSGGVILEDFDADGLLDVMVSSWGLTDPLRLFRNRGDGGFEERTDEAGLSGEYGGLNLCHADYDNDGDADVLVLRGAWLFTEGDHPNSLLRNRGDGTFENATIEAGLLAFHPTHSAAWGDYDNDGWLDLFVGNESLDSDPHPSALYRNDGDGTFSDVSTEVGLDVGGFVKGVAWGDYDNDGRMDLYLSRSGNPNLLFHNEKSRDATARFTDVTEQAGVAGPLLSFPVWFWDYDNDGWEDLLVAPYSADLLGSLGGIVADYLGQSRSDPRLTLYRNDRDGTFTNVAAEVGLDVALLAMGANFGDLNNDGFLDAYFGTGEPDLATLVPNRMFLNVRGERFADVTTAGGFGHLQKGHGVGFGDIDNDGDQDIYAVMGGAYAGDFYPNVLFENPGNGNRWITLTLEGRTCNRSAIGARIRISVSTPSGPRDVYATVGTGGSFGSSSVQQEIGLGNAERIESVEVRWPGHAEPEVYDEIPLDRFVRLRQGDPQVRIESRSALRLAGGVPASD